MPVAEPETRTFYVVQSFTLCQGCLRMDPPSEARTEDAAIRRACGLAQRKPLVYVFSRAANLETGELAEPNVVAKFQQNALEDVPF